MVCATLILLPLALAACSSGDSGQPENNDTPETTGPDEETSAGSRVEQLVSEAPGQGPERPRVVLASSASVLSQAAGARIPDAGAGTYLAAFWGEKPTGGYSVKIHSVRVEGNQATIRISLHEPPPDAMLTQALTYPYTAAVARDESLGEKNIHLEDQEGRRLDWPVRHVGSGG